MRELDGRVVLVTGGGRGLGEAICRTLAAAGAAVVCGDVQAALANRVAADIETAGGAALPLALDVRDERQTEAGVRRTLARYGRLDALVNNAGVDVTHAVEELAVADWDRVLA